MATTEMTGTGTSKESPTFQELQRISDAQSHLDKALDELANRIEAICSDPPPQVQGDSDKEKVSHATQLGLRIDNVKTVAFRQVEFVNKLIERIEL